MVYKLVAVSVSCSPELPLSFSATRAASTPLLTMNTSCPLMHKNKKIALVYAVSFSLNTLFNVHTMARMMQYWSWLYDAYMYIML